MLARLLCRENIEIREGNFETASFDTKNRILRMPKWDFAENPGLCDMVIGHEISHAKYTDDQTWKAFHERHPNKLAVLNIIEDIRIERKIQKLYPGLITPFREGRQHMFESDLFQIAGKDPNTFGLLDRINIRAKLGDHVKVDLSDKEQEFFDRCEKAETMAEVVQLAEEAIGMIKDEQRPEPETLPNPDDEDMEEGEEFQEGQSQPGDQEPDEDGEDQETEESSGGNAEADDEGKEQQGEDTEQKDSSAEDTSGGGSQQATDPDANYDFTSQTQKAMEEFLDQSREKVDSTLYTPGGDQLLKRIVSYEKVQQFRVYNDSEYELYEDGFRKFEADNKNRITFMVNEFNRKKAAYQYSRATESRSGRLNMNKLHQYKLDDNIFQSVTQLADAKDHGMIMFIDYSGSMGSMLNKVICQTAVLVMFCKKVGIPFEVYGFTTDMNCMGEKIDPVEVSDQMAFDNVNVIELVSSRLNREQYHKAMVSLVGPSTYENYFYKRSVFESLGGTPLDETIILSAEIIDRFKKKHRIQKTNVIFLTDGDANAIHTVNANDRYINGPYRRIQWRGRQIQNNDRQNTSILFKELKQMTDCTLIGYRMGCRGDLGRAMQWPFMIDWKQCELLKTSLRKEKCVSIKDTYGYDILFLIREDSLDIVTDDEDESEDASQKVFDMNDKKAMRQMQKEYSKAAAQRRDSRVFVNKFTEIIA